MALWPIASVNDRPNVTLRDWAAFEVSLPGAAEPTRHLVGWSCEDHHGQVSSPIVHFDPATAQCVTASGRIYRLAGGSGWDPDAAYVWKGWKRVNDVSQEREVTDIIAQAITAAKRPEG